MDDANIATHLLHMCLAKWQPQYNSMENTTHVSNRALLFVLENIENNAELNAKPSSNSKARGPEGKCKMELIDSHIPKMPEKVIWSEKHGILFKKHVGPHMSHNTRDCCRYNKNGTPTKKNGGCR